MSVLWVGLVVCLQDEDYCCHRCRTASLLCVMEDLYMISLSINYIHCVENGT